MQVDRTTPLWIAARALLSERGEDFFRRKNRALKTSDAVDIHDLRVASRRLREGLDLFAPCYPAGNIVRLAKRLKRVTRLLGEIRNTDEAILFFTALVGELHPEHGVKLEGILGPYRIKRKKEMKGLRSGLKEIASDSLNDLCRRVINAPSLFTPQANGIDLFMPLSLFAGSALDARLSAVLQLLPEARQVGETEAQHLLRIAIKHFRYRMEILSFLFTSHYDEIHETLKDYQDLLGKMHDLDVFAAIVRDAGYLPSAEESIQVAIGARRDRLFADFSSLLESRPLETLGERMRISP